MWPFVSAVLISDFQNVLTATGEQDGGSDYIAPCSNLLIPLPSISYRLICFLKRTVDVYRLYLF